MMGRREGQCAAELLRQPVRSARTTRSIAIRGSRACPAGDAHRDLRVGTRAETVPDQILILPWTLRDEIGGHLAFVRDWGGMVVFPIPELEVAEGARRRSCSSAVAGDADAGRHGEARSRWS